MTTMLAQRSARRIPCLVALQLAMVSAHALAQSQPPPLTITSPTNDQQVSPDSEITVKYNCNTSGSNAADTITASLFNVDSYDNTVGTAVSTKSASILQNGQTTDASIKLSIPSQAPGTTKRYRIDLATKLNNNQVTIKSVYINAIASGP